MPTLEDFIAIFREQEEELSSTNYDFVSKINELLEQENVIVGNKVGNRYSSSFTENISRPSSILQCGSLPKDKKKKRLEEQAKRVLSKLQEQDLSNVRQAAELENELFKEAEAAAEVEVNLSELHVCEDAQQEPIFHLHELCEHCDMRHAQEERECELCEQIHSGCCDM